VAGRTDSSNNFAPTRNVFGIATAGTFDAFVSKLSNDLSQHKASAILGSPNEDRGTSVIMNGFGRILVAGFTYDYANFTPNRARVLSCGG